LERLRGIRFKRALMAGIQWFSHYRQEVDRINVFPVPDGDTGKNMHHAFQAASKAMEPVKSGDVSECAWAAARGALMGGRGCSGMILSGFFSGFAEGIGERRTITAEDFVRALQIGSLRARERVEHPRAGTILSVGEAAAHKASEAAQRTQNVFEVLQAAWQGAQKALNQTPQQLPELKKHHVVDAGGQGLVYFFEGLVRYSRRQSLDARAARHDLPAIASGPREMKVAAFTQHKFCTEFLLSAQELKPEKLRRILAPLGEHLMVASAPGGVFKIHIHTQDPDLVFARVEPCGAVTWRKVDDMEKQHHDTLKMEKGRTDGTHRIADGQHM
jgi:DAK2 domain fusion protein YloV